MSVQRFERARDLFLRARELPADQREQLLASACGTDAELKDEVLSLLGADTPTVPADSTGSALGLGLGPAAGGAMTAVMAEVAAILADQDPPAAGLPNITGYRILGTLGEGGMGAVYEAEQHSPRRRVALKVVRPGLATPAILKRFEVEKELLARLEHPGIARIYEAGTANTGHGPQPYFAMELVRGTQLIEHAQKMNLSPRDRLDLLARICDAVQHAHQKGVIHRDLKPANILVTEDGQPKVLDFGVARAADGDGGALLTAQTHTGQIIGTLQYMSPEQAAGIGHLVDTRSDVYALGLIAFELLTGQRPFDFRDKPLPEALRTIQEDEPTRLGTVDRTLRGDVETIVGKALSKERDRRYGTVGEFGADVRRFLNYEPVTARQPTTWYQLRRFARRNRALVAGVAATIVALAVGLTTTVWQASLARAGRREAEERLVQSLMAQGDALVSAKQADKARGAYLDARSRAAALGQDIFAMELAELDVERQFGSALHRLEGHAAKVWSAAFSSDQRTLVTGDDSGEIRLWDAATGKPLGPLGVHPASDTRKRIQDLQFSPDGELVASVSGDRNVHLWSVRERRLARTFAGSSLLSCVRFDPTGDHLITGGWDGSLSIWNLRSHDEPAPLKVPAAHKGATRALAFLPDGKTVLTGGNDKLLKLWEVPSGQLLRTLEGHAYMVQAVVVSRDGSIALSTSGSEELGGEMLLWDMKTGKVRKTIQAGTGSVDFCSDDGRVALIGAERGGGLRIWHILNSSHVDRRGFSGGFLVARASNDGRTGVSEGPQQSALVWNLAATLWARDLQIPPGAVRSVIDGHVFSPDGRLVAARFGRDVAVWDAATGQFLRLFPRSTKGLFSAVFSADGSRLLTGSWEGVARLWDIASEAELQAFHGHLGLVAAAALSPDGAIAVTIGKNKDNTLRWWDVPSGKQLGQIVATGIGESDSVRFLPGPAGRILAGVHGPMSGLAEWDLATGQQVRSIPSTAVGISSATVSPDGRHVLVAEQSGLLRLVRLADGAIERTFGEPGELVRGGCFLHGGRIAVTGVYRRGIRFWDVATGTCIRSLDTGLQGWIAVADPTRMGLALGNQYWDLQGPARTREVEGKLAAAGGKARAWTGDPTALAALGEWQSMHGRDDWAAESYRKALSAGATIPALTLARCFWRANDLAAARIEFQRAISQGAGPVSYLKLCLSAVERGMDAGKTALPATSAAGARPSTQSTTRE